MRKVQVYSSVYDLALIRVVKGATVKMVFAVTISRVQLAVRFIQPLAAFLEDQLVSLSASLFHSFDAEAEVPERKERCIRQKGDQLLYPSKGFAAIFPASRKDGSLLLSVVYVRL